MIHGHEVLRMMEGNSYASAGELVAAIVAKFGADARFHTCSGAEMDAAQLVAFFEAKGKFMPTDGGFTMDRGKVCKDYCEGVKMADELKTLPMAEGLAAARQTTGTALVDVREAGEFAEGHIPGALNVPLSTLAPDVAATLKDKSAPVFVYCHSGRRSQAAGERLVSFGYSDVTNIGGILDYAGELEK